MCGHTADTARPSISKPLTKQYISSVEQLTNNQYLSENPIASHVSTSTPLVSRERNSVEQPIEREPQQQSGQQQTHDNGRDKPLGAHTVRLW